MPPLNFGQRAADVVTARLGSWRFLIAQTIALALWVFCNLIPGWRHWDAYPFIFLNLMLSFQAAYTGPIVMISQNRQEEIQRDTLNTILLLSRATQAMLEHQTASLQDLIEEIEERNKND